MTKIYKKNELVFALLWIALYFSMSSLGARLSERIGNKTSVTALFYAATSFILFFWIRKNDLSSKYGLRRPTVPAKRFLFYLPLAVVASTALWSGVSSRFGFAETLLYLVSMCCVGFLEELIFRGFLFRALEKDSPKTAVLFSALSFGLSHFVNFFNGSGQDPLYTAVQILFAVLTGLVLVLIFWRGASLLPCILFHAVNNALFAFESAERMDARLQAALFLGLILPLLGGYLFYLIKLFPKKND